MLKKTNRFIELGNLLNTKQNINKSRKKELSCEREKRERQSFIWGKYLYQKKEGTT
jgi:hypothetical protein